MKGRRISVTDTKSGKTPTKQSATKPQKELKNTKYKRNAHIKNIASHKANN